jgi:predicted ArsR family transcriptional regulator
MAGHNHRKAGRIQRGPANRQRQRILELVREHDGAVDAEELAEQIGLHVTTVRFHLDALCSQGVVERTRIARASVGRPRTGYLAVRDRLDYRGLAEILALELGDTKDQRRRRAEAAGRRWAQRIQAEATHEDVVEQDDSERTRPNATVEDRAAMVASVFARMGFGPELAPPAKSAGDTQQAIRLHACPIRELARAHPEVGCSLHRGLLQGLLTNATTIDDRAKKSPRSALQAELQPFVKPDLCIAKVIAK